MIVPPRYGVQVPVPSYCVLAHWHGSLGRFNGTEPSMKLLVTPVPMLLQQAQMCAVK